MDCLSQFLAPYLSRWKSSLSRHGGAAVAAKTPASRPRPKVGVGVFVRSASRPWCVLLGKRKGSAGAGTWALPGGHLEFGESWAECAAREVFEETGLVIENIKCGTVINSVEEETNYHYVVVFMVADVATSAASDEPENREPDKCDGWQWTSWNDQAFFDNFRLFRTLEDVRSIGFNPFSEVGLGNLVHAPNGSLPPYCCCILREYSSDDILLEARDDTAAVATGKLTCFGGKREKGEAALACIQRELLEELGYNPMLSNSNVGDPGSDSRVQIAPSGGWEGLRRAVDLYVDGKLIAWFFEAAAPARDAKLVYEKGRSGVWLRNGTIGRDEDATWQRVSPWHRVVLEAWKRGERRADFITPIEKS
eukprot:TRINITY_DN63972_c0_g1_i1.p1 TRINITY_DN63972_c0_g1~~TRINITY_DN63972_c0_g1_i1.p1  ORF type:complete len:379 (+),score=72.49 TRINITY_DN63972_c0_g1_i1:45-1139(+)